jgi:hypothetical protein
METEEKESTRSQMNRAYGCIRAITKQLFGYTNADLESRVKAYLMLQACENGYPFYIKEGICTPVSFKDATKQDFNIVNLIINRFADQYYPELGRPLYLYQEDAYGKYKSIGGRTRLEMKEDYPELQ